MDLSHFRTNTLEESAKQAQKALENKGSEYVVKNWYFVPLKTLSKEEIERHKKSLTFFKTSQFNTGCISFRAYVITSGSLGVPFYYGIQNFGPNFKDLRFNGNQHRNTWNVDSVFQTTFTLNEEKLRQETAATFCLKGLESPTGGSFLCLPPGDGKTQTSLLIWGRLCKTVGYVIPLVILVDKKTTAKQWIKEVNKIYPNVSIGELQKKLDYHNAHVVLHTVQGLCSIKRKTLKTQKKPVNKKPKPSSSQLPSFQDILDGKVKKPVSILADDSEEEDDSEDDTSESIQPEQATNQLKSNFDEIIQSHFGMCIIDESHHWAAPGWSEALSLLAFRYRLFLTGTPERADGNEEVLYVWTNRPPFQPEKKINEEVLVQVFIPKYPKQENAVRYNPKQKRNVPDSLELERTLASIDPRNDMCAEILAQLIRDERRILGISSFSDKVPHLDWIRDRMTSKLGIPFEKVRILDGSTKAKDLEQVRKAQCILTNYSAGGESLNIDGGIDTLVFLITRKFSKQHVNRLFRGLSSTGKPKLIVLFKDFHFVFQKRLKSHLSTYSEQDFNILPEILWNPSA